MVDVVIQWLSRDWHFATPWTAAHQAPMFSTISRSLLKFLSVKSTIFSNHLILCCHLLLCLQSFPPSGSFPVSRLFASGGQSIRASAVASVLPVNIQDSFPLGLTSLVVQMVKNLPGVWETLVQPLGQEDPLEKGMATHSGILAWRIPWTEEPGGLQPMRS